MIYTGFGSKVGHFAMFFLTFIVAMAINASIMLKYDLRAGFFAIENYELVDKIFSKPWTKLAPLASGVWLAHVYMAILEYRKMKTPA